MTQFSSDIKVLIFLFGIFWGIKTIIKECRINKTRTNKKCFPFFALAVFFFEVAIVMGIFWLCTDWFIYERNYFCYALFSWALSCFCYSGYMFSGIVNDDEAKKEKFRGKVAIAIGLYWLLATIVSYEM